jgi:hypothetical protein
MESLTSTLLLSTSSADFLSTLAASKKESLDFVDDDGPSFAFVGVSNELLGSQLAVVERYPLLAPPRGG